MKPGGRQQKLGKDVLATAHGRPFGVLEGRLLERVFGVLQGRLTGRVGALAVSGAVALAAGVCSLGVGSALALSQRGHVLAESFALAASEGGLSDPQGVAVNEAGGDLYVVDAGNNRVDRFNGAHELVEVWGWGVENGNKEYERCTHECRAGLVGFGQFELSGARSIAVDNSTEPEDPSRGDVYVEVIGREGRGAIDKFGPEGEPLTHITHAHGEAFEEPHGIAVDPDGALWVYDEEDIYPFSNAEPNKACPEFAKKAVPSCPGAAVLEPTFESEPGYQNNASFGIALDGSGNVYLGHESHSGGEPADVIGKQALFEPAGSEPTLLALLEELDHEPVTGVAADQSTSPSDPSSGDVFVDHGDGVAVYDSSGALVQRLLPGEPLREATGVAVDSARDLVYVAEGGARRIDVFGLEGEGAPSIAEVASQDVGGTSAQLDAQIDPTGAATSYVFRVSPSASVPGADQPCDAPCRQLPAPAGELAAGYGEDPVSVLAGGLAPATGYRFRVLATNAAGGREQTVASAEASFTTPPSSGEATADARGWELVSSPTGGGVQAQTEAGGVIQAAADGQAIAYVASEPAGEAEGSRSIEVTQMLATRGRHGWASQDIVTPNEHGDGLEFGVAPEYQFFSSNLALALVQPFPGGGPLAEPPLSPPAGEAEEGKQEKTIYLRDDQPIAPAPGGGSWSEAGIYAQAQQNGAVERNPGYLALVTAANTQAGAAFGGAKELVFRDATPDLSAAVIESPAPLTAGSASAGENLYEWRAGKLTLLSVLPGSERTPAESPSLGLEGSQVRHALSNDGTRAFWSAQGHLYMTDTLRGESIQLDAVQGGSGANSPDPVFQTASADGSRVFFTDQQRLTPGAGADPGRPDLYVCEIAEGESGPSCALTDLTAQAGGEPADVQGLVIGAGENGSIVYFVADGALASDASPGQCRPEPQPGAQCNLYVDRYEEGGGAPHWGVRLVARLSAEDSPDWYPPKLLSDLGQLTSRVSPNGRYLAFMSQEAEAIAGYDNRDANPEAQGARDEEVFLYDASAGKTVCASCDPSGARPRGVFDPAGAGETAEGIGLLVDRTRAWAGHWLAGSLTGWTRLAREHALYESRYLSDSGRLYFDSPADLTPQATNGKEDVYEYEPLGVPRGAHACSSETGGYLTAIEGCLGLISSGTSSHESAFLDASETGGEDSRGNPLPQEGGGDVFFLSAAKLLPQDASAGFAVYDAHECADALPCLPAGEGARPECDSTEACGRGAAVQSPGGLGIQTAAAVGNGNIVSNAVPKHGVKSVQTSKPQTAAQKLTAALRQCRLTHKRRQRRQACEAQARRKYGKHGAKKSVHTHTAGRRR